MYKYIFSAILAIIIWEFFPVREWFYNIKDDGIGKATRLKMTYVFAIIRKYNLLFRLLFDFIPFYYIFLWNDGLVLEKAVDFLFFIGNWLANVGLFLRDKFVQFLFFAMPFLNNEFNFKKYDYTFILCAVCTIVYILITAFITWVTSRRLIILITLPLFFLFLAMMNTVYFLSGYIMLIPVQNKIILTVASVLASILAGLILWLPYFYFMQFFDIFEKRK